MKKDNLSKERIKKLLSIEDEMGGEEYIIDSYKKLKYGNDVIRDLEKVTIAYAVSSRLEAEAEYRVEVKKAELSEFFADLEEEAREYEQIIKPTDQRVKAYIERNPEYRRKKAKLAEFNRRLNVYKGYRMALKIKSDMLRTKAASVRIQEQSERE